MHSSAEAQAQTVGRCREAGSPSGLEESSSEALVEEVTQRSRQREAWAGSEARGMGWERLQTYRHTP